jgi:hypothetical protein
LASPSRRFTKEFFSDFAKGGIALGPTSVYLLPALLCSSVIPSAQIHLQNLHKPLPAPAPQFGKNLLYQFIPLLNKIAEGGANKNPDEAGLIIHK